MDHSGFNNIIEKGGHIHFVGIGGVSMSCIAETLFLKGAHVSGSDMQESPAVVRLRRMGICVSVGHSPKNVEGAWLVIYTAAVKPDNPELVEAIRLGIPIMERAEALGHQMQGHREVLCVAGTHGKSTTTAMAASVALAAGMDPTVMIGADFPPIGGGYRLGDGGLFIAEACEYTDSFLKFYPTVALILNVDNDHLDYFGSISRVRQSFGEFASLLPEGGRIVANCEDENTMLSVEGLEAQIITFGLTKGDVHAANLIINKGMGEFDIVEYGKFVTHVALNVFGEHNVLDALGAAAAMLALGASPADVMLGLGEYKGIGRRMEYKGMCNGAKIMDDYAHHPEEMRAVLSTVKTMGFKRVICAFQPHTYSRMSALMDSFAEVLSLCDIALVTDIYAAREKPVEGVSAEALASRVEGAVYVGELEALADRLRGLASDGDLIITMGAGSINRVAEMLVKG